MRIRFAAYAIFLAALSAAPLRAQSNNAVVGHYADTAQAMYGDALTTARALHGKIEKLIAQPSQATLDAAKTAWIAARHPYQNSEAFRFGNPIVDEWEGRVNAWPLDEGLIDYVDASRYGDIKDENPWFTANVIANPRLTIGGRRVDARNINWRLLRNLHEAGAVEANVATGYHAIEFLLWGQDLNGTGPGAGNRPWTDYAKGTACTNGNCDRRGAYLLTASRLLVDDLGVIVREWGAEGDARKAVTADARKGLSAIVTGLGSLSYGELAGERMKLGLLLHDPEEEHDCFSDNTHNSHYDNIVGMRSVYLGEYTRPDGKVLKGPGLSAAVAAVDPALDAEMKVKLAKTLEVAGVMKRRAETVERYDQMLAEGNAEGNAVLEAVIAALIDQTRTLERISGALKLDGISFEKSDSLDAPDKVGKK